MSKKIPELERDDAGSVASILAQDARHQRELEKHVQHIEVRTSFPFKPDAVFVQDAGGLRRIDEGESFDLHQRAPESFGGIKATFELALDPFERIELAAAAWRNAYRAHERRDREAVERHLREAIDHGVQLIRGLYG